MALPETAEDVEPLFEHQAKDALPFFEDGGVKARLILGSAWGAKAPVKVFTETFYIDAELAPGALMPLPDEHEDRGVYVVSGAVEIGGERFEAGRMMVFRPGDRLAVKAGEEGARLMLLGGETLGGPALHLVELRRVVEGADRGGEGGVARRRLGARALPPAAGGRRGVHPGAGAVRACDGRHPRGHGSAVVNWLTPARPRSRA